MGLAQTRLSTGKRINSAADDPAGLTIATKLRSRSQGLKVALGNIGDAKNLLAVAEAGVGRITDIITQMKNKASQAASDTMGANERSAIQTQLNTYAQQIDDIVNQTTWNSNKLINGTNDANPLSFQTGADAADVTSVSGLKNLSATEANGGVGGSLRLAATSGGTGSPGFTLTPGGNSIVSSTTAVTTPGGSNATPLAAGTYKVRVTDNLNAYSRAAVYDPSSPYVANPKGRYISAIAPVTPGTPVPGEVESGHYRIVLHDRDLLNPLTSNFQFCVVQIPPGVAGEVERFPYTKVTAGGAYDTGLGFSVTFTDPSTWPLDNEPLPMDGWDIFYTKDSLNTQVDKVELLDSNGNPVQFGANTTDGSGAGVTSVLIDADTTGGQDINFGNGLKVHLAQKTNNTTAPETYEDTITYATSSSASNSTYNVMTDGDGSTGGVALDDTSGGRTVAGNYRQLMTYLDGKLDTINKMMSKIGAFTGRLEFKEEQVSASQINVEASYNRIMNANMAEEQVNASKFQILQQTAISMLAQANQAPASLLTLFR
jgi:flagellin-like hook-associated protein FlgL